MTNWQQYLEEQQDAFLDQLIAFCRIASISSLPEHADDVKEAATWVAERMRTAGIENVRILPTGGHPVVYGDWLHAADAPTVMIYGHFDTQPVDPEHLWSRPPFDPVVLNDRLYARGATDDKGNMLAPILATEALLQTENRLPLNVKFFFEGQEEIGSPQLPEFIAARRDELACDMVISADGGQWEEDQPALSVAFKGLCGMQIDVLGAKSDLHSGMYGGSVANPIHALVAILDSMRDADGTIAVEGFYDSVRPLTEEDRKDIAAVPFDDERFKDDLGVDDVFGEPGYSTLERRWARPTLEVNGIWGGFTGEGVKTVLPNLAHAKITCRLVAAQEPEEILDRLTAHVQKVRPPGVKVTIQRFGSQAYPYLMPSNHPGNEAARAVHLELYGKEPLYIRSGGTIPVTALFLRELDAYTVNFAFALGDENVHAPDEYFRLASFRRAQRAYAMLIHELAQQKLA